MSFPGRREFIIIMAAMAALDAFSIDAMIPALDEIGSDLGILSENHRQYIITSIFLGFSIGVLIYGFFADRFGRRRPAIAGFLIYILGTGLCVWAEQFSTLLFGRLLQGLGAAGPYVISIAIIRDKYEGRKMANILSLVLMTFIGVPIIAPFVGQGILLWTDWRGIFIVLALYAVLTLLWFVSRLPETLRTEDQTALSFSIIGRSFIEVLTHRQSLGYLLATGCISGAFIAYLSTGQQVFQDIYQLENLFPAVFASLAASFGVASYFNSRWVESVGSARLVHRALNIIILSSLAFLLLHFLTSTSPPLWAFVVYMTLVMFCYGLLFGNMTSLTMEPMGHIAGSASSIINSLSTTIAIVLATVIGSQLTDTVFPVVAGFGVMCVIAWILNYQDMKARGI